MRTKDSINNKAENKFLSACVYTTPQDNAEMKEAGLLGGGNVTQKTVHEKPSHVIIVPERNF